jgi:Ca2+-binding RTX toxin-like protein
VHALDDAYAGGTSGDTPVLIDITSSAIGSSVSAQPATLDTEVTPVADPPAFKALAVNYVADSLTGDSIDLTKWQVVLPSVPGTADDASVTPTANGVVLHDHGYLETTSGFTPTAATPLHVSLSFSLDDGIGPYVAVTDGTDGTTGAYGSPANGLSFMFGWGHGLVIANNATGQSVDLSAGLSQGTVYDATITDDGSHQTVAIVDHSTGQTVGTYTSDFTDHAAGDLVTITNREANDSQHDATISNVTISNAFEGEHGVPIALSGLTALTDTDGSEQMSLDLSGFPDGTTFSVGQPGTGAEAGHWLISAADIASLGASALTMTAPADYAGEFSLNVSGTVVDQATGLSGPLSDTKTFTSDVAVKVDGGGPVIDTTHFVHTHNEDGTDALTDLSVSGSATETYSLSAVTAGASDGSSVSPCQDDGASLDQINTDLASVTYSPGQSPPANDMITLTVTDSAGIKDTVNFIFNEGGEGPVTLDGTTGKDVIFATTTNDTLTGGGGKDQFVFAPSGGGDASHTITDFIEGLDKIDLRQFSDVSSIADLAIAQQQGTDDTLVSWHQQISHGEGGPVTETEQLLLKSVIAANLKASDFIFHIT